MNNLTKIKDGTTAKYSRFIKAILLTIILVFTTLNEFTMAGATTVATGSKVTVTIDYIEEIAIVTAGPGGSTKFYMSTDNKKTWDIIEPYGAIDLSAILQTKAITIYFKGNKDTGITEIPLQEEDKTLKATYLVTGGEGKISFNVTTTVEYRKGANGVWKTATNPMSTSMFELKGATLYFRTPPASGKRVGKTISLKVSKRPSAPAVKLDGSKLNISGLKAGSTQYRVGDNATWITFQSTDTKIKTLDLYSILGGSSLTNTPIPAGVIEFRTFGTDKKATSAIKVLEIPLQQTVPDTITVTGSAIKITDTDTKRAYEYTKISQGSALNLATAKWSSVSTKNALVVPKAVVGDKILVRLKSKTDATSKQIIPASTYKEFTISSLTTK